MTNNAQMATISIAGIEIVAPVDLVRLAGWSFSSSSGSIATDDSSNKFVSRRVLRALSEQQRYHDNKIVGVAALAVLSRCVELGEVESLEGRRDNIKIKVAQLELDAETKRLAAAELECKARGL